MAPATQGGDELDEDGCNLRDGERADPGQLLLWADSRLERRSNVGLVRPFAALTESRSQNRRPWELRRHATAPSALRCDG